MKIEITEGSNNGLFKGAIVSISELKFYSLERALMFLKELDERFEKHDKQGANEV